MELRFKNTLDLSHYGGKLFKPASFPLTAVIPLPVDTATPEGEKIRRLIEDAVGAAADTFVKETEKKYKEILLDVEHRIYARAEKELPDILKKANTNSERAVRAWLDERVSEVDGLVRNAGKTFESVFAAEVKKIWATEAAKVDKQFKSEIADKKMLPSIKIGVAGVGIGMLVSAFIATIGLPLLAGAAVSATLAGSLGALKKVRGFATTLFVAITKNWPRHKTAAAAAEQATGTFSAALRDVELAAEKVRLGVPKAAAQKDAAVQKAGAAQIKLMDALHDLRTWNHSLRQDIERGAQGVKKLELDLEAIEKKLEAEKNSKKADELRKACVATVAAMGKTLDSITGARKALEGWDKIVDEGSRLVASKDCTSQATGKLAQKLKAAAQADTTKQVFSAVKMATTAAVALADIVDAEA